MSIREIVVQVGDVDAAVDFYTRVGGFTHVRTVREGEAEAAELDAGGQRVTLVRAPRPGITLALDAEDGEAARRRLRAAGVADTAAAATEGGTWTGFRDPWGNPLGYLVPEP